MAGYLGSGKEENGWCTSGIQTMHRNARALPFSHTFEVKHGIHIILVHSLKLTETLI